MLEIEVSREASRCGGSCRIGRRVVKLCAVYGIAPGLSMQQRRGSDRAWVWTACNFGDRGRKVELLAVRFKRQDVAGSFKQTCDEAKQAHETGTLITPRVSRTNTARASPCGKDAVAGLEGTGRVAADLSLGDAASDAAAEASELWSTSETPQKPVVSPAKFVFQAESVKSVFSSEKTFPFGNTSAPSSLFGFGVHPPRKSAASQKAEQEKPGAAEPPKSCGAPQKPLEGKASQLAPAAQDGPSNFSFKILEKGEC